jgi:hypothetical protein
MKKHPVTTLIAGAVLLALVAAAPPPRPGPKRPITVTGEILDLGCYLSRGLRDEIHRECALKCLGAGIPMGLLGPDSTVYILTQNHDRAMDPRAFGPPDPFAQCKDWPAKQVAVTGLLWERKGYKELEVKAAKLAPVPPKTP